jgi:hypothetical protein
MSSLEIVQNKKNFEFINLTRTSHFASEEPSVTLRDNVLYCSTSAVNKLELYQYKYCYFSLRNCLDVREADKIYLRPNNDELGGDNCKIKIPAKDTPTNGATISGMTTIYRQVDRLKNLLGRDRKSRKIVLKFCEETQFWYMPLSPSFEYQITKDRLRELKNDKAIYKLLLRGRVQNIGQTNDLARRMKEKEVLEIPFDEVHYSLMNHASDDTRKDWEYFFIESHKKAFGDKPPYNLVSGRNPN